MDFNNNNNNNTRPGTLILMLPDLIYVFLVAGLVVTMAAMLSMILYGYRVENVSDMGQAMYYWSQFMLFIPDRWFKVVDSSILVICTAFVY